MLLLLLPLSVLVLLSTILLSFCAPPPPHLSVPPPSFLRCSPSLPLSPGPPPLSRSPHSLPPSLHWLVSRDTFIRARLCGERGQIAQADHRPCQIPRERGRHNRQHFVGRDRFCKLQWRSAPSYQTGGNRNLQGPKDKGQ